MTEDVTLTFDDDGTMAFVYEDAERVLGEDVTEVVMALGTMTTARASFVEPLVNRDGWSASMEPMGGPVLGPFDLRREALSAERAWLRKEKGL